MNYNYIVPAIEQSDKGKKRGQRICLFIGLYLIAQAEFRTAVLLCKAREFSVKDSTVKLTELP